MKIELNENTTLLFLCIAIGVSLIVLILSAIVVYLLVRNKRNVTEPKKLSHKEQREHTHYTATLDFGKQFVTVCGKYSKSHKKGLNVTTLESNVTCGTCRKLINKIK